MSEIMKVLDLAGVGVLVEEVKAADAKVLQDAKDFANSLAGNYESAGSVATAVQALKDGEIKANADAIAEISEDYLKEADKTELQGGIDAAQAAADAAQGEVDALEAKVGEIPEGYTESTVIAYINKKAEETLSSATGGSSESAASVKAALDTYKAENNAAVQANADAIAELESGVAAVDEKADANAEAISAETTRATGIEAGLRSDVDAIKDDYLKAADKEELEGKIKTNADALELLGKDDKTAGSIDYKIAQEVAKILNDNDDSDIDTLEEIAAWIKNDTAGVADLNNRVTSNADAIKDIQDDYLKAADKTALQGEINAAKEAAMTDASTKDIQVLADAKAYADSEVAKVASSAEANAGEIETLKTSVNTTLPASIADAKAAGTTAQAAADAAQGEVDALEAKVGTVAEGKTVVQMIADAQAAATYDDTTVKSDVQANATAISELASTHSTDKAALQASVDEHADAISALEIKVGAGYEAITSAEISALFNPVSA